MKQERNSRVRCTAWLGGLRSLLSDVTRLEEEARGPGRHAVFMAVNCAKGCVRRAVDAEMQRLERPANAALCEVADKARPN